MISAKMLLLYLLQTASVVGVDIDSNKIDLEQAYCLAQNIYYEARSEDIKGQFAVASVTLNRAKDPRFPDTVCEVIKQSTFSKSSNKTICQFSWYCDSDKKKKEIPVKNKDGTINQSVVEQFQTAGIVAIKALSGKIEDDTKGATHFHRASTVKPEWSSKLKKTVRLGNHDFYK